jgi:hypothetical protein
MRKFFTTACCLFLLTTLTTSKALTQGVAQGIPDSVANVPFPGSTGAYNITNPLTHNGTSFTNPPVNSTCFNNCKSDYLYFYDLGFQIPATAQILGVEVIHTRGGCNSGSWVIDTLHLAYNGAAQGLSFRDSASTNETDTLGSTYDTWGLALTPAIVNSNSFGVMINTTGTGICTFGQFDVRINVYYCDFGVPTQGIPDSVANVAFTGSTGAYTITNPLNHNGTQFTNPPVAANCANNCVSDWLYFYDFGFNIPANANLSGFEVVHTRGGCNSGSWVIDTVSLAFGGGPTGGIKRDSASNTATTILGSPTDIWGNVFLSIPMINDPSFGVAIRSTGTGICTLGQFDVRLNVYYCGEGLVGMQQAVLKPEIVLYPNPATDVLYLRTTYVYTSVSMYNALGQRLDVPIDGNKMDIATLPQGTYFVVVQLEDGRNVSRIFVKAL